MTIASFARRVINAANWRAARLCHRRMRDVALDQPTLSVCFDDFPQSAARVGAAILEEYGGRGTFYATATHAGRTNHLGRLYDPIDIADLVARGHEIGCHTHAHPDCTRLSTHDLLADVAANTAQLQAWGAPPLRNFAYPYGHVCPATKAALAPHFDSMRGVVGGVAMGRVDGNQLPAVGIEGPEALNRGLKALETALAHTGWVIAFSHDVQDNPSPYGIRPDDLRAIVRTARDLGFAIVPVAEVWDQLRR